MLLKQFLNKNEIKQLLDLAKKIEYTKEAKGFNVYIEHLKDSHLQELSNIIKKVYKTFNKLNNGFIFEYCESFFIKILNNGFISAHQDWIELNKKVLNFNLILEKPKKSGYILHGDFKIKLNAGDAYILDASIIHGVTTVSSDYYSLVFWFYKDNIR